MNYFRRGFIQHGSHIKFNRVNNIILKPNQYMGHKHKLNVLTIRRFCTKETPPVKPKESNPMHHVAEEINPSTAQGQYLGFERKLMETFELRDKKKARQLIYGGISIFIAIILFYETLKSYFSKQTAEAVSATLQQDELQKETDKLAKLVVKSVLKDDNTFKYVGEITSDIIRDKSTQEALQQMLYEMYVDPVFQNKTKEFVKGILEDPSIQEQVTTILKASVNDILEDNDTKVCAKETLVEIMDSEEFIQETYVSVWSVWKRLCTFGLWK